MEVTEQDIRQAFARLKSSSPVILEGKTEEYHKFLDTYHSLENPISRYFQIVDALARRFGVYPAIVNKSISYRKSSDETLEKFPIHSIDFSDEQSATIFINGVNSLKNCHYLARVPETSNFLASLKLGKRLH